MIRFITSWALVLGLALPAVAADYKIATVNLQKALNESKAGQDAKEGFKGEVEKLQSELERQKQSIENLKVEFEKKGMVLKEDERRNLERDYKARLRDFERTYKDTQADLQQRDNELTAEILQEIQEVILEYGPKQGYTLILEASNTGAVLYDDGSIDITDAIIEAYDAKWKARK